MIDEEGQQLGIFSSGEAVSLAKSKGYDLIEIVPNANPPVCKIIDVGKYKYELQKKEKLQKKNQHVSLVKEIRLHPNTDVHDFNFKAKHAIQFLIDGHKVKIAVIFKGREIVYKEQGEEILQRFINVVEPYSKIEQEMKLEGKHLHAIVTPDKQKIKLNKTSVKEN